MTLNLCINNQEDILRINFSSNPTNDTLIIGITEELKLSNEVKELDKQIGGLISKTIDAKRFGGKKGNHTCLVVQVGDHAQTLVLFGMGKERDISGLTLQHIGGKVVSKLKCMKLGEVSFVLNPFANSKISEEDALAQIAYGAHLKNYNFDKYKSAEKLKGKHSIKSMEFVSNKPQDSSDFYNHLANVADGVHFTRDLVSEPGNVIYPDSLAKQAMGLSKLGVKVEVLGEAEMKKLGMDALLGVGIGSCKESKLIVMQYSGGKKGDKPIAFVGKGVTFDSGGLSLKPSGSMEEMKYDMGGSAVVIGLMKSLAAREAEVNVVGVVGSVENMPDGKAQRPGDVVKSMSGQTIEILNTDAEGRLVLADALWYTQDRFKPKMMINLATLTGAVVVALGNEYAGLFSNDDDLANQIFEAGKKTDEKVWRFPLSDAYDRDIDSDIADMRNTNKTKGAAGSITAAQFLQRFVNKTKWAHLDIAGVTWIKAPNDLCPKGATGFGVRLLNQLVADYYE
jgi:leucyl aminopeptidase